MAAPIPDPVALESQPRHDVWGPLRQPLFRWLWLAAIVSYTGSWMHNVGAGWLMTRLTTSSLMISLVQAAMSFPVFLVALIAGAIADMVDRRRLLILTQSWMAVAAAILGILAIRHAVTPSMLLFFTFLLGLGAVMNDPAWQAITPEIVETDNLPAAVALNSAAFNVARAIGPALGGIVIATTRSGVVFLVNAASFLGVIFVLTQWKRISRKSQGPAEGIFAAIRNGILYVRQDCTARAVLVRTGIFSLFASALWALLPAIARPHGSIGYGILFGFFGSGALGGAAMMHYMRRGFSSDRLVASATLLFAGATISAGFASVFWVQCVIFLSAGIGWINVIATFNLIAQTTAPDRLRARMLSMYVLALHGSMSIGSGIWGEIADSFGIETALTFAAAGLVLGLAAIPYHSLRVQVRDISLAAEQ